MASTSTLPDRQEMLFLGKECHHPACHLNDFLPFSCPACHLSFCQPHFLPSQHSCKSPLPKSMQDRIAPQCPICNEVVPTPPGGGDPNEAVERHILHGGCVGMEGGEARRKAELKRRKEAGEVCYKKGCSKVLVVRIKCESCTHSFCPSHRHAKDHSCGTSSGSSSRTPTPQPNSIPFFNNPTNVRNTSSAKAAISRLLPPSMQPPVASSSRPNPPPIKSHTSTPPISVNSAPNPIEARAAAAAAAMKRAGQDVKVPFVKSKTDKRAEAEMQSAIQAMKARHEKGLLSKQEEVKYAELVAKRESGRRGGQSKGNDKDGCVIC